MPERPSRAVVAIDRTDHAWLKETAGRLNIEIIDIIRTMIEQHRKGGTTDLERLQHRTRLEKIRLQKEKLIEEEDRLLRAIKTTKRVPVYDGDEK